MPAEPGTVLTVAESLGFVRQTSVGPVVDVQIGALPPVQAFTARPLTPRTHQVFRDPLPTVELVHCIDDAAEGGEKCAKSKHHGKEQRHVDSERTGNFLVVDAGAQHGAESRAVLQPR